MKKLDDLDRKIIRLLSEDGRLTPAAIAERLGVTAPTVRARIRALEESGTLKVAGLVDPCSCPEFTLAIIGMNVRAYGKLDEVMDKLVQLDNVISASVVTGRYDIIAEVVVQGGNAALYDLTSRIIPKLATVDRSETFVIMSGRNKWVKLARGFESWGGAIEAAPDD
ncbi:MAG: Lrp/AsnC family transcriptional regulator [Deltaproteobacteria bacterium]|nr:MAG: Lrp/AsnC family transcriptional regulator [Deltaproteobacteria bacterium]